MKTKEELEAMVVECDRLWEIVNSCRRSHDAAVAKWAAVDRPLRDALLRHQIRAEIEAEKAAARDAESGLAVKPGAGAMVSID